MCKTAEDYQISQTVITTTMAFLTGARKEYFEGYVTDGELVPALEKNTDAVIMRALCNLRSNLMLNFSKTESLMRYDMKNIDRQDMYMEDVNVLFKNGVNIVKANYTVNKYLIDINTQINNRLEKIKPLFPEWVEWAYIKDLFIMPKGTNESNVRNESVKYQQNQNLYPYKRYIHWNPVEEGNILFNDSKFLGIIYGQHGDYFVDKSKVLDASANVKGNIYDFIDNADSVVIVVDCENSDAFKLASVLTQLDSTELAKIKKIMLYDDEHTTNAWRYLGAYTKIPTEYILVERINEHKSLVDLKMGMGIAKAFYKEEVDSFILASSDSDYWGVIDSLPDADFLCLIEYDKCGYDITNALDGKDYYYCSIDDFCTANINDFKNATLLSELRERVDDLFSLNANDLLENIYLSSRINATEAEKKSFYERYIKKMSLTIDAEGNFKVKIPD